MAIGIFAKCTFTDTETRFANSHNTNIHATVVKLINMIHPLTTEYNNALSAEDAGICNMLCKAIHKGLPDAENKIWHAHPVWFLDGNPVVGYSKMKDCVRLMFWSGQSFDEKGLLPSGSFKAAEIRYTSGKQVNKKDLENWLKKASSIQWDYKNIVKRKGVLVRLK